MNEAGQFQWGIIKEYEQAIKEGNAIAIIWTIQDVRSLDESLTDEEAQAVLEYVADEFDANEGVNWYTIEDAIQIIRTIRDAKKEYEQTNKKGDTIQTQIH